MYCSARDAISRVSSSVIGAVCLVTYGEEIMRTNEKRTHKRPFVEQ